MHVSPDRTSNSFRDAYSFPSANCTGRPWKGMYSLHSPSETRLDTIRQLGDGTADKTIVLNIDNTVGDPSHPCSSVVQSIDPWALYLINPPFFDINGVSYVSPSVPVLLQLLSGAKRPEDLIPSEQVFIIPKNSLIEVTFPVGQGHPFHCKCFQRHSKSRGC